jgi:hypothetical protein
MKSQVSLFFSSQTAFVLKGGQLPQETVEVDLPNSLRYLSVLCLIEKSLFMINLLLQFGFISV